MKRILFLVLFLSSNCFGAPILQWKMNDNAASSVIEDNIGSLNGTFVNGGNDYTSENKATGVASLANGAMSFDGIDDNISVGQGVVINNLSALSASIWFKRNGANTGEDEQILFDKWYKTCYFDPWDEDKLHWIVMGAGTNAETYTDVGIPVTDANWHHVVATYLESTRVAVLYLDGIVQVAQVTGGGAPQDESSYSLMCGSGDTYMYLNGFLDNFIFYNTVLEQAEIRVLYNSGDGTDTIAGPRTRYSYVYRYTYRSRYN